MVTVRELRAALEGVDGESMVVLNIRTDQGASITSFAGEVSYKEPDSLGFSYFHIDGKVRTYVLAEAAIEAGFLDPGDQ